MFKDGRKRRYRCSSTRNKKNTEVSVFLSQLQNLAKLGREGGPSTTAKLKSLIFRLGWDSTRLFKRSKSKILKKNIDFSADKVRQNENKSSIFFSFPTKSPNKLPESRKMSCFWARRAQKHYFFGVRYQLFVTFGRQTKENATFVFRFDGLCRQKSRRFFFSRFSTFALFKEPRRIST